ncbi:MAG: hypothetical protein ABIO44_13600 [Saprospiraceae bacterium]
MSTINNYFDLNRFRFLLKREFLQSVRPLIYVCSAIMGSYTLGTIIQLFTNSNHTNGFNTGNLITSLGFALIIWASISFHEIANTPGRQQYLSLPASHLEKLSSKWFIISLVIPILFTLFFVIAGYLNYFIIDMVSSRPTSLPSFDWSTIVKSVIGLIGIQSLFYVGSIIWPKHSIFKTGLSIFVFLTGAAIVTFILARIIFPEHFNSNGFTMDEHSFSINFNPFETYPYLPKVLGIFGSIFFMTLAYFKLKEKEL